MRLEGVQRALGNSKSEGLFKLEHRLKKERMEILLQEELLWLQKSRWDWLAAGDDNTKFFHSSTLIRRRRNRVGALLDNRGIWVDNGVQLKNMVVHFYRHSFSSNPHSGGEFVMGMFPTLSLEQHSKLDAAYSLEETRKALMSMGPLKASGLMVSILFSSNKAWSSQGLLCTDLSKGCSMVGLSSRGY